jgi:alpha-tubulin suppressor-like RCC1 family protein
MTSRLRLALLAVSAIFTACSPVSPSSSGDIEHIVVSAVSDTLRGLNRAYQFHAFAFDNVDRPVSDVAFLWSSSDEAVAKVDDTGLVQTVATGNAGISAGAGGVTGESLVLVSDQAGIVTAGDATACALDEDGYAHCWGTWGGLSDYKLVPERLSDSLIFHSLSGGWSGSVCGLTTDGDAFCWGGNSSGALGDGTFGESRPEPTPVVGDISFKFLRSTDLHTCGIALSGDTYCWGQNDRGQLGTATIETCTFGPCSTIPVRVETDLRFRYLSLSSSLSCGLEQEGTLYCWGQDASGTPIISTPTAEDTDVRFEWVAGAHSDMCGLGTDGVTYCWELWIRRTAPTPIGGPHLDFLGENAGGHFCGLDVDGRAFCWGSNTMGQLGNGTFEDSHEPMLVSGGLRFTSVAAGDQFTCGMTFDSEVYCWGMGALGIGTEEGDGVPGCEAPLGNGCWTTPKRTLFNP